MTLKEYLHIRQNMLHNPAYLMGFGQQVRNQILERMAKFAQKHGVDVPGFSGLSATDVRKSVRAEIVLKARSKRELESGQRWITIHPGGTATRIEIGEDGNEKEVKNYRRVLIDEDGKIVGGGVPREWQGRHISKIGKESPKDGKQNLEYNMDELSEKMSHVDNLVQLIYKYVYDREYTGAELVDWLGYVRDEVSKLPKYKNIAERINEVIDFLNHPSFHRTKRSRKYWEDKVRILASKKYLPNIIEIEKKPSVYHVAFGRKNRKTEYKQVTGYPVRISGDDRNEFPMFYYEDPERGSHGIYDLRTGTLISDGKSAEDALLRTHIFFGQHGMDGTKKALNNTARNYGYSPSWQEKVGEENSSERNKKNTEMVRKSLQSIESKIRNNTVESGYIVDGEGNIVWSQTGGEDYVNVKSAIEQGLLAGNIFTHNHPSSSSFSPEDVNVMLYQGLKEMRAVGKLYTYRIRPPENFEEKDADDKKYYIRRVFEIMDEEYKRVYQEFQNAMLSGRMTAEESRINFFHEVWKSTSKRIGLFYERRKTREIKKSLSGLYTQGIPKKRGFYLGQKRLDARFS